LNSYRDIHGAPDRGRPPLPLLINIIVVVVVVIIIDFIGVIT
jgi:hypothetical protein